LTCTYVHVWVWRFAWVAVLGGFSGCGVPGGLFVGRVGWSGVSELR